MTDDRPKPGCLRPSDAVVPAFGVCMLCLAAMVPLSLGTLAGAVDEGVFGYAVPVLAAALALAAVTLHTASPTVE
ncbi:MAG: hypothetical protein ABEJ79_05060 [Halolamina sp.]